MQFDSPEVSAIITGLQAQVTNLEHERARLTNLADANGRLADANANRLREVRDKLEEVQRGAVAAANAYESARVNLVTERRDMLRFRNALQEIAKQFGPEGAWAMSERWQAIGAALRDVNDSIGFKITMAEPESTATKVEYAAIHIRLVSHDGGKTFTREQV